MNQCRTNLADVALALPKTAELIEFAHKLASIAQSNRFRELDRCATCAFPPQYMHGPQKMYVGAIPRRDNTNPAVRETSQAPHPGQLQTRTEISPPNPNTKPPRARRAWSTHISIGLPHIHAVASRGRVERAADLASDNRDGSILALARHRRRGQSAPAPRQVGALSELSARIAAPPPPPHTHTHKTLCTSAVLPDRPSCESRYPASIPASRGCWSNYRCAIACACDPWVGRCAETHNDTVDSGRKEAPQLDP